MSRSRQVVCLASVLTVSAAAGGIARAADPSTGECLAATESSLSLRHQHKLRDARAKALICSAPSCPTDIREECARRVGEINVAIPTIVFDVRDADGGDLVAVKVSMDGQLLTDHLDGTAVAIDPGPHTFTFEAAGQPRAEKKLIIREGQKDRNEVVTVGTRKVAAAPVPAPARAPTPGPTSAAAGEPLAAPGISAPSASPAPPDTSTEGHGQRVAAVTVGIVGVAAVGAGAYFSYLTHSLDNSVTNASTFSPSDDSSGHTAHTLQFVMYGAGAAALAAAVILYAVAPSGQEHTVALAPAIGPRLAGGTLAVRF
ncbi:MAG TPA: hypothetical protein VGP64_10175 [Polyangia bacterium]|jgi:hypothetical protein